MVPFDSAAHSAELAEHVYNIAYVVDLAASHVNRPVDSVRDPQRDPRGILDVDKVALGGAVAPNGDDSAALLRVVKFLDQRRNGVPSLGIEPVARPKKIGRYDVCPSQAVAVLIGFKHGEHCKLGVR